MGPKCDDDVAFQGEVNCVSCSICLDVVADDGNRSWAKLQCGHRFHLDCIGSAFNAKGAMQCPNCRKIEKGQWLFPNGSRSFPDYSMEDWTHDEDLYELGYSEMSFGAHWSPFGELANLPTPFEERGYSSAAYHELLGQHATFAEHTAISAHPCPYIAYLGPFHPPSSFMSGRFADSNNSSHWNGQSLRRELPEFVPFPAMDLHHHVWENPAHPPSMSGSRIGNADLASFASVTQRSSRTNSDASRSGSSGHHYHIDSSGSRSGGSVPSSLMPPYPGSNVRAHDRVQALQAYYQQQPSHQLPAHAPLTSASSRQSSGQRSVSQQGIVASSHALSGSFFFSPVGSPEEYIDDGDNISTSQFHSWERDHLPSFLLSQAADQDMSWEPSHSANIGPEPVVRRSSFRRRGSERSSSYNRS